MQTVLNFPFTTSTVCNLINRALHFEQDTLSGSSNLKISTCPAKFLTKPDAECGIAVGLKCFVIHTRINFLTDYQ
jgi:hypothetical protein